MGQLLYILKKHYFYFTLAAGSVFGMSSAGFLSASISTLLDKGPSIIKKVNSGDIRKPIIRHDFSKYGSLLSGALLRDSEEALAAQAQAAGVITDYILMGTVFGDCVNSLATIQTKADSTTKEYPCGGKLGDFRITWIGREKVYLKSPSGERFTLYSGEDAVPVPANVAAAGTPVKPEAGKPVEEAKGGIIKKVISRENVNRVLADQTKIFRGISMGPMTKGKDIVGYRINRIRNNHFFYELGARSGDVISRVNGQPFGEMEKMLKIWEEVKTASQISIDLDRKGVPYTYELYIKN